MCKNITATTVLNVDPHGAVFLPAPLVLSDSQALGDSDFPAVLRQLLPLMQHHEGPDSSSSGSRSRKDECGPDELILLLVYLYSLADEAQPSDHHAEEEELEKLERELIGALTLLITNQTELSPMLQKLTGERINAVTSRDYFQELFSLFDFC